MPRMSKAKKEEMAMFINNKGRITYHPTCKTCKRSCKQSFRIDLIACPNYERKEK